MYMLYTENDRFCLFCNLSIVSVLCYIGTRGQATYSERTDARYRGTDPAHPGTDRVSHQICRPNVPRLFVLIDGKMIGRGM